MMTFKNYLFESIYDEEMIRPGKPRENATTRENDYYYHTTYSYTVSDIKYSGKLKTGRPQDSEVWTDEPQQIWPDGSSERRSYWCKTEADTIKFSRDDATVIRVHAKDVPGGMKSEGTGDYYARKSIPASKLEYLGEDEQWHPIIRSQE